MNGRTMSELTNSFDENDERNEIRDMTNNLKSENDDEAGDEENNNLLFSGDEVLADLVREDSLVNRNIREDRLNTIDINKLEVDNEITVLLQDLEDKNLGKSISSQLRNMMKKMLMKYAGVLERKQREMMERAAIMNAAFSPHSGSFDASPVKKTPASAPKSKLPGSYVLRIVSDVSAFCFFSRCR
jgi:hypothetical protein